MLACCLAAVTLLIGCGPANPAPNGPGANPASGGGAGVKRIIFLINTADAYWDACNQGLVEGEKQFDLAKVGLKVQRDVPDGTAAGQIEKLRQYGTQSDIAGVAVSVLQANNEAIIDEMKNLQAKGIPVIAVDGDVNRARFRDARTYYIGTENITAGRVLGVGVKKLLKAKGKEAGAYVQFVGYTDNDNAISRMNGVTESLGAAYADKDRIADETDRRVARDKVRSAITNHPDLVALIGIWAYNAPAIADVVGETQTRDKFVIGTFDAQSEAIEYMEKGSIDVMVVQNPFDMGVQTVKLMKAMIQKDEKTQKEMFPKFGQPDGDIYTTGLRVVVPSAESPVKAADFESFGPGVVEFMLLPDFKAWLKKYNLTSS